MPGNGAERPRRAASRPPRVAPEPPPLYVRRRPGPPGARQPLGTLGARGGAAAGRRAARQVPREAGAGGRRPLGRPGAGLSAAEGLRGRPEGGRAAPRAVGSARTPARPRRAVGCGLGDPPPQVWLVVALRAPGERAADDESAQWAGVAKQGAALWGEARRGPDVEPGSGVPSGRRRDSRSGRPAGGRSLRCPLPSSIVL